MHNNGNNYWGGMHMGWWFLVIVLAIGMAVWFVRYLTRK